VNQPRQGAARFSSWCWPGAACASRANAPGGPKASGLVWTSPEERALFSSVLLVICAGRDVNFQVDRPQAGPGLRA